MSERPDPVFRAQSPAFSPVDSSPVQSKQMSTNTVDYSEPPEPKAPRAYAKGTGKDRLVRWTYDYLEVRLTPEQAEILRAIEDHQRVLVYGANSFGKTMSIACLALAWMNVHYRAISFVTAGSYKKLRRTYCREVEELHSHALSGAGLPGTYKHANPRIQLEDEPNHFFEADKPAEAGELEGLHTDYLLGIVDEADKDAVDESIIDSMDSLISDERDRLVVVANPPDDKGDIVYDLKNDPTWHTLQFSSFDSHNVKIEMGEREGEPVSGLATLDKIRSDWVSFNGEEWPGAEAARDAHRHRDDLDTRWLRRRAGVIPGDSSLVHRPFTMDEVNSAYQGEIPPDWAVPEWPNGLGMDVARSGGDQSVLAGQWGPELRIIDRWSGDDHVENRRHVMSELQDGWDARFAVDATPEGSGLADELNEVYPNVIRFQNHSDAAQYTSYKDKWSEGLALLGDFFEAGGVIRNRRLREELRAAAQTVEFEEKYYASREDTVYKATSKDDIKERIGRSPDSLDAALQAVWAASEKTGGMFERPQVESTWAGFNR